VIPGVVITMGGTEWTVPPLTLGQLRRLLPKVRDLTTIGAAMGEDQITILTELVAEALGRNYPEITPEKVEELLDLGNAREVLNVVLTGSGLKPTGEAMAVSSGVPSTACSPPPAVTATP
jgi:hypothetical protein